MVASSIYRGRPWASSQILSRKGANNGHFEGEHLVQVILTKVGLRLPKGTGDDAVLGSMVTSILPLRWSWSCCTETVTFA